MNTRLSFLLTIIILLLGCNNSLPTEDTNEQVSENLLILRNENIDHDQSKYVDISSENYSGYYSISSWGDTSASGDGLSYGKAFMLNVESEQNAFIDNANEYYIRLMYSEDYLEVTTDYIVFDIDYNVLIKIDLYGTLTYDTDSDAVLLEFDSNNMSGKALLEFWYDPFDQ